MAAPKGPPGQLARQLSQAARHAELVRSASKNERASSAWYGNTLEQFNLEDEHVTMSISFPLLYPIRNIIGND